MIDLALNFAAPVLLGLAGWNAGRTERPKWAPKAVSLLVLGWCLAFLLGHGFDIYGLVIAAAVAAGASLGPGNAIGPAIHGEKPSTVKTATDPGPEKWQIGPIVKSTWLSLLVLGFLWGALPLVVLPWVPDVWMVTIACTLGIFMAAKISVELAGGPVERVSDTEPEYFWAVDKSNDAWAFYNTLRGPIIGMVLLALMTA